MCLSETKEIVRKYTMCCYFTDEAQALLDAPHSDLPYPLVKAAQDVAQAHCEFKQRCAWLEIGPLWVLMINDATNAEDEFAKLYEACKDFRVRHKYPNNPLPLTA